MSTSAGRLPAQVSPLGSRGISLDTRGPLTASGGVLTLIDDYLRPPNKAKNIINFHQFTRGVFSSGGGGWQRDNENGLNGGADILDFGTYIDALGNQYLLAQAGNTLYTYDTAGHAGTALGAPLDALTTALPCIRPSAPTGVTTSPFSIYCNGVIEPQKISGTAGSAPNTVSALGFDTGFLTQLCTVGGVLAVGNQLALILTSSGLSRSPLVITYTIISGDTTSTAATGLAAAINANTVASQAQVSATSSGSTVTISYPSSLSVVFNSGLKYETATVSGTIGAGDKVAINASLPNNTETATVGGVVAIGNVGTLTFTSVGIPSGARTVAFTATTTVTADMATGLTNAINTDKVCASVGIFATVVGSVVTINYPTALGVAFSRSAGGSMTIVLAAGSTGTTIQALYTEIAGDTVNTTAAGLCAAINSTIDYIYSGLSASVSGAVVTIPYPSTLTPAFANTGTVTTTLTLASTTPANPATLTLVAGAATSTWPGIFNGKTYTKPALCAPFLNRMAYIGFSNGGASGNAVAFDILISSARNAEGFVQSTPTQATDAWSDTIPASLGLPTAIHSFRPLTNLASEILVVGCQNGMVVITGTDATTFAVQIQSTAFGIPSNRAFAQLDNSLFFLATDGLRVYNGSNNIQNLITDTLSLDFYDEFLKIDRTAWQKAHVVHHRDTQEIWFWVPYNGDDGVAAHGDNGIPSHAFILNYNTLEGTPIWYFINNTACTASIEFNHTFFGGDNVGLVEKWYGVNNYDDAVSGYAAAQNILPGASITLAAIGVNNPAQYCSINNVVVGCSENDQKFLINASAYEVMDDGSMRKQQQHPVNYTLQSKTAPQTVLGPASPAEWTLDSSAFPSVFSKLISGYVPLGHGKLWEFELICNDTSHNLDFTFLQPTISIGGQRA